jgi:hypothetical protein
LGQNVWPTYLTMHELVSASTTVVIGTVASVHIVGVDDSYLIGGHAALIPVTDYNVTVENVLVDHGYGLKPGFWMIMPQVGGTVGHVTMNVTGYPTLVVGASYLFFVTDHTSNEGFLFNGLTTTGGAQGLFSIQGGSVYSLDNMYPQADAWLPIKADGVPLATFIAEVQSAAGTNSSAQK